MSTATIPTRAALNWVTPLCGLLMLGIAGALLYLNQQLNWQLDWSANARHSLASASVEAITQLPAPLEIITVIGPDPEQREAVALLVQRYQQHNPDVTLELVNPDTQPERTKALNASPEGEMILRSAGREQRLQAVSERSLTTAIYRLGIGETRQLGIVTGHDEREFGNDANAGFAHLAGRLGEAGFGFDNFSLVSTPVIPQTIDVLVLAAPQRDFFPGEVASMLQHISSGGNLLWLVDGGLPESLQPLALELGVDVLPGRVLDANGQALDNGSPLYAILDQLPQHPITEGVLNPMLLPGATALAITPLAGQQVAPLLMTGDRSWTETGELQGAVGFDENTQEQQGPLVTGVTIERSSGNTASKQRIAVIGDADFLANQWIGNGANQEFATRLMDWLAGGDKHLDFSTLDAPDARIQPQRHQIFVLGGGFLLLLPVLFLIVATALHWRRRHG